MWWDVAGLPVSTLDVPPSREGHIGMPAPLVPGMWHRLDSHSRRVDLGIVSVGSDTLDGSQLIVGAEPDQPVSHMQERERIDDCF